MIGMISGFVWGIMGGVGVGKDMEKGVDVFGNRDRSKGVFEVWVLVYGGCCGAREESGGGEMRRREDYVC